MIVFSVVKMQNKIFYLKIGFSSANYYRFILILNVQPSFIYV
jgi:hypothetical protein